MINKAAGAVVGNDDLAEQIQAGTLILPVLIEQPLIQAGIMWEKLKNFGWKVFPNLKQNCNYGRN